MFITSDLKKRLSREFFARLVSQLKSSSKPAPSALCTEQSEQPVTILEAKFEANADRMQMAAVPT
jgi:hypothetical protein